MASVMCCVNSSAFDLSEFLEVELHFFQGICCNFWRGLLWKEKGVLVQNMVDLGHVCVGETYFSEDVAGRVDSLIL